MDFKIKNEVKALIKLGFPENIAIITACANNGKSEHAQEHLEELAFEQSEIIDMLKYLVPFGSDAPLDAPLDPLLEKVEQNIIIGFANCEPEPEPEPEIDQSINVTIDDTLGITENLKR